MAPHFSPLGLRFGKKKALGVKFVKLDPPEFYSLAPHVFTFINSSYFTLFFICHIFYFFSCTFSHYFSHDSSKIPYFPTIFPISPGFPYNKCPHRNYEPSQFFKNEIPMLHHVYDTQERIPGVHKAYA